MGVGESGLSGIGQNPFLRRAPGPNRRHQAANDHGAVYQLLDLLARSFRGDIEHGPKIRGFQRPAGFEQKQDALGSGAGVACGIRGVGHGHRTKPPGS